MRLAGLAFTMAMCGATPAFAANGIGGLGPTSAPTPVAGPGGGAGHDAKRTLTITGTDGPKKEESDAARLQSGDEELQRRRALEKWTTYFEAVQPGFLAIGAVRELPLGMRAGAASGMILVSPAFLAEVQTPAIHAGNVRVYAAASGAWMYVPRVKITGESARAWGAGPKIGFEWRLPMSPTAKHGWHLGADAGILFGDWSSIFGTRYKKSLPTFTPLRIGYYW